MNRTVHPPAQALGHLKTLSTEEEAQHLAFVRERVLRDEISELQSEPNHLSIKSQTNAATQNRQDR